MSRADDPAAGRRDLALVRSMEADAVAEVLRSGAAGDPAARATNVVRMRLTPNAAAADPAGPEVHDRMQQLMAELVRMRFGVASAVKQFQDLVTPETRAALDGPLQRLRTDIAAAIAPGPASRAARGHAWQQFNAFGNSCHHPGCQLTEEQHEPPRQVAAVDPDVDARVLRAVTGRGEE